MNEEVQEEKIQETPKKKKYRLGNDISFQEDSENFQALCRGEQLLVRKLITY